MSWRGELEALLVTRGRRKGLRIKVVAFLPYRNGLKRLPLRIVFPILAAALFAILSLVATRQTHAADVEGWEHPSSSSTGVAWRAEPVDIGTPADVLLHAFNLAALTALLALLPLDSCCENYDNCFVFAFVATPTAGTSKSSAVGGLNRSRGGPPTNSHHRTIADSVLVGGQ